MSFFNHFLEDIRKAIACICCLILLGPFLLVIGIWQFTTAPTDHQRADNIHQINLAIDDWTQNYQQQFSTLQFSVYSLDTSKNIALQQDNSADSGLTSGDIKSYRSVKFDTTRAVLPSVVQWTEGLNKQLQFTSPNGSISFKVTLFDVRETTDSESTCNSNQGEYLRGTCYYYYVLTGICAKVSTQGNAVQLDTTYGGPGCWYDNGYSEDYGRWIPAYYTRVPYDNGRVLTQNFRFDSITTMIRSQHDPYIFAQNLTKGSMSYGLTPGEKLAVGIALIVIGAFFMLPCCIFITVFAYCFRRRHHHHDHYYPVYT